MAKQLSEKTNKNPDFIDASSYEWTKEQSNKSLQSNLIYGTLIITMIGIYLTCGYLLVQKIKN